MRYLLLYLPLPIFILILQTGVTILFPNFIHHPDLILIFCVYSAHYNGRFYGELLGAYAGLCEDVISATPFGVHIIIRTVISFIIGHTIQWRVQNPFIVPVILVLCALCIKYLLYLLLGALFSIANMIAFIFDVSILYEALYTIIATPILFSLLSLVPNARGAEEI